MPTPETIHQLASKLSAHQQRVAGTAAELLETLAQPAPAAIQVASLRWRMLRELRGYQIFKHQYVFAPMIARGGLVSQLAQTMKHRCETVGQRVEAYVRHWSGRDVAAAWAEHRNATAQLLAAIERHADTERRGIERMWQLHAA